MNKIFEKGERTGMLKDFHGKRIISLILISAVIMSSLFCLTSFTVTADDSAGADATLSYPLPILSGNEQIAKDCKDVIKDLSDIAPGSKTCYVTKDGAGDKSGSDDANAMPFATLIEKLNPSGEDFNFWD